MTVPEKAPGGEEPASVPWTLDPDSCLPSDSMQPAGPLTSDRAPGVGEKCYTQVLGMLHD